MVTDVYGITRIIFHCAEAIVGSRLSCIVYRNDCTVYVSRNGR